MTTEEGNYQVHIGRLVRQFGEQFYDDPVIVLRELVSNASDANLIAESEGLSSGDFKIEVFHESISGDMTAYGGEVLVVRDNGIGMNKNELQNYLSYVCTDNKEKHQQKLLELGKTDYAWRLIGKFGLGFLTTFVISKKVIVETLSRSSQEMKGWRWESSGNSHYRLTEFQGEQPGTTIRMHIDTSTFKVLRTYCIIKRI